MKKDNLERYFAEIVRCPDGRLKVKFANKLVGINQHKRAWKHIDARNFARLLNKADLVIK